MPGPKPLPLDRMWSRVDKSGDCWLWRGATVRGYGAMRSGRSLLYVHRVAWEETNGPVPVGMVVRHRCDVPLCVRPDHLELGTQADNIGDAKVRGRMSRGEARSNHKATEADVLEMWRLHALGLNARQMADRFPISERTIRKVLSGKNWTHVTAPERTDPE